MKSTTVGTGWELQNFVCCPRELGGHVYIVEGLVLLG